RDEAHARLDAELPALSTRALHAAVPVSGDELGERLRALEERPAPEPLFDQLRAVVARVDDLGRRVEEEAARKDSEHLHERIAELAAQVDGLPSRLGGLSSREELEGVQDA